ncbi:MAG: elongation factor G, partial [Candidatus Omnitrophica bacterium]|nr:elongation factor G [Candidatus Omnitrophota bacterium]
ETSSLAGFVFKNIIDPYVGQLSMVRIFSGKLPANTSFYNVTQKASERIGQVYFLQGKEQRAIEAAACGDIIAIPKLKITQASDTISDQAHPVIFKPIIFPEAMISASVKPRTRQDEEKITQALAKLVAEDHTFRVKVDQETHEMLISGLGDLHLNIMVNRLKKRFNVEVDLGTPKVPYKETITKTAKVQGKFKRQSGGRGQYGDVWIEVHPLGHGKGFEFVDKVFGGAIPKNYIPSVEKGVRHAMNEGAVSGNPMVDIQVILYDGSFHEVDSSDMAFQRAGGMALRKAVLLAGPALLEPIMDVEVFIPEEFLGQISGDLNQRRGRPMGMEAKGKGQVVKAIVPWLKCLLMLMTYVR